MIDLGARYYDPRLGRFHSADSVVAAPATGRDWNRYSYGRNNPLRYTDPTGHAPEDKGGGDDEPDDTKSGDGSDRDDGEDDGVCVTVDGQLYCPVDSDWAHAGGAALLGATVTGASGMDGDNRGGGAAELAEAEAAAERMARIHHQAIAEQARLDNLQLKLENMLKDALLAGRRAEVEALEAQLAQLEKDKASLGKDFGLDVDPNLSAPLVAVPGASASLKLRSLTGVVAPGAKRYRSRPVPVVAVKNRYPPREVRSFGSALPVGWRLVTRWAAPLVLIFHSSRPLAPSLAWK